MSRQPINLLITNKIDEMLVELTQVCNLRCIYCGVSDPEDRPIAMNDQVKSRTFDFIHHYTPASITLNGRGETTFMPNWMKEINALFDQTKGHYALITNLAKNFTDEECDVLSRFQWLTVSLDTTHPDILKALRRKVDIRTFTSNLVRIRAAAIQRGEKPPYVNIHSVISKHSAPHILKLASYAVAIDANQLTLSHLDIPEKTYGDLELGEISDLEDTDFLDAVIQIRESEKLFAQHGKKLHVLVHLGKIIEARLLTIKDNLSARINIKNVHIAPAGSTRLCLKPWNFLEVRAKGDVHLCCTYDHALGSVHEKELIEIVNDVPFQQLRFSLLQGELTPECQYCTTGAPICSREQLQTAVIQFLTR